MFDFIGCHSFYINRFYDFHGFLSMPALSERPIAVTRIKGGLSSVLPSLGHRMTVFINQLLNSCCCSWVKCVPGESVVWSCCDSASGDV